ncbi:hypothetical protein B0J14DRAFT_674191 [Halenospora varia]|nr:hypothetical protein B0J14DRAFT_674191 [Halenospora varia]
MPAQAIDFAAINAAPSPTLTRPPIASNSQVIPYNTASAAASGSVAVTAVASASATASQAANSKRWLWWPWGIESNGWGSSSSTTPAPTLSSTSMSSTPTTTPIASTATKPSTTGTATTSLESSCPTEPEAGTYCGFINPEDPCAPQPDDMFLPVLRYAQVTPDTVAAFYAYAPFHQEAQAAKAPSGYASTFVDLTPSISANIYLSLTTLQTYDVSGCSTLCNNKDLFTGFNIFVERDPSLNSSDNCPQSQTTNARSGAPASTPLPLPTTNKTGKTNNTTPATCPGWQPPKKRGGDGSKAHNHPSTCIGTHFYPGPYNPLLCANFEQFVALCKFLNSYMVKKNGKPLGTYCGIYAQSYQPGGASYQPGWQGADWWDVESSWSYEISN